MSQNMVSIKITTVNDQETIKFAADELCSYLNMMISNGEHAVICQQDEEIDGLKLGLFEDFKIEMKEVIDCEKDDAIYIDISQTKGIIAGSNPRSVLFAVYRFLEANGCKWLRPGKDGEIVPKRDISNLEVRISEKAELKFRGNADEGDYSYEHIIDRINWAPKVGLNTLMSEYFMGMYTWYQHQPPTLEKTEKLSKTKMFEYQHKIISEIKKRGLIFQFGGHGWTSRILGLSDEKMTSKSEAEKLNKGNNSYIAMINGERKITQCLKCTDLCYGNHEVRNKIVQCVADYAEEHPEVDLLHYWLSDLLNSQCECDLCKNTRPSDFYIMILNGIDVELTKRCLETRIVFISYMDLLWAPEKEIIKNPDRFVMMLTRGRGAAGYTEKIDYNMDYSKKNDCMLSRNIYVRNKNKFPHQIGGFVASTLNWRKIFTGDVMVWDYHTTWFHNFDQGYYGFVKVLADDIRSIRTLGFNGYLSCQLIRLYFPNAFPLYAHAKLLWNTQTDIDIIAREYFNSVYGMEGQLCLEYMMKLSELFMPSYLYNFRITNYMGMENMDNLNPDENLVSNLSRIPCIVEDFMHIIERNMNCADKIQACSWRYLFIHSEIVLLLAKAFRAKVKGDENIANAYWTKIVEYIMANKKRLETVFDANWFFNSFKNRVFVLQDDKTLYEDVPEG